jgi:hypothetical protein
VLPSLVGYEIMLVHQKNDLEIKNFNSRLGQKLTFCSVIDMHGLLVWFICTTVPH